MIARKIFSVLHLAVLVLFVLLPLGCSNQNKIKAVEATDAIFLHKYDECLIILKKESLEKALGNKIENKIYFHCLNWINLKTGNPSFLYQGAMLPLYFSNNMAFIELPKSVSKANYSFYDVESKIYVPCEISVKDHQISFGEKKVLTDRIDKILPSGALEWK